VGDGRGGGGEALLCHAAETGGILAIQWTAAPEIPEAMSGALRDHLHRLAAPGAETAWNDERRRLIPAQQLARRMHAGGAGAPFPRERLEALVAARAEESPDRPALVTMGQMTAGRSLSYGELLALSRRLGSHLRDLGAGPGLPVAVVQGPGWEAAAAILAILAAGAAWVPIDPVGLSPRLFHERLGDYLAVAPGRPALAVTTREMSGRLAWPSDVQRVLLDEISTEGVPPFRTNPSAADLACIIPLPENGGPMIEHRGLANTVLDVNRTFGIGPGDRFLALSPLGSPLSLYELFGPLAAGGTLVVPEGVEIAATPETVAREGITVWVSAPEPLVRLLDEAERTGRTLPFRLVLVSGRVLPLGLAGRLRAACPAARLARLTPVPEAPLWSAIADLDAPSSFYGRPLANLTLHVLDDRLEPRPDGVAGRLHLGGPGLARGWWRAPADSAARFAVHPDTGERLFQTGETARVWTDGAVEVVE
jgi:non-ribosomal peptide synthetase component F